MKPVPSTLRATLGIVLFATTATATPTATAHMRPLNPEELVRWSNLIVVGVVVNAAPAWNAAGNLIETEYAIEVLEWIKGESEGVLLLSMPGGTVGEVTVETCLTVPLEVGARYLLFLEDPSQPLLSPLTGAAQGAFQEVLGEDGVTTIVAGAGGSLPSSTTAAEVPFEDFLAGVRTFVEQVEATPWTRPRREEDPALPARDFDPNDRELDPAPRLPAAEEAAKTAAPQAGPSTEYGAEPVRRASLRRPGLKFRWEGLADTPIGWNAIPSGWIWYPHDQYQMSKWNAYGGGVHYIIGPYSKWGFGNGRFDIAGFPPNSQMLNQFGRKWGSNELGVTFSYKNLLGDISEADIALNPAFQWTLDEEQGARGDTTTWSFQQTMLHELGHGHGLKHPWEYQNVSFDSVMNYSPKNYRLATLTADDAEAIRDAYYYLGSHDGMISAFSVIDLPGTKSAGYEPFGPAAPVVEQGATLSFLGEFTVQTPGTDHLSSMTVEVHLCPKRMDWTGCTYAKTVQLPGIMPPFTSWTYEAATLGNYAVPSNLPTGVYYIALKLDASGNDEVPANNASWVNFDQEVTVLPKTGGNPGGGCSITTLDHSAGPATALAAALALLLQRRARPRAKPNSSPPPPARSQKA